MHICAPRFNSNPQAFHRGPLHRKRCVCSKWSPLHSLKRRRKIAESYRFYKGSTWIIETFWLWKVFSPHHSHSSRGEFACSFHTKSVNWNHHKSLERSLFNRLNTQSSFVCADMKWGDDPTLAGGAKEIPCVWPEGVHLAANEKNHFTPTPKKKPHIQQLLAVTSYSRLDKIFIFNS